MIQIAISILSYKFGHMFFSSNFNTRSFIITIVDTGEVARVNLDYVYFISGGFIALAALMCYRGYRLQKCQDEKSIIYSVS